MIPFLMFFQDGPLARVRQSVANSGGAKERTQRAKKLYESVGELSKTIAKAEEKILASLTSVESDKIDTLKSVLADIKPALAEISKKLDETNEGLRKLSGNTTLLSLAFGSGSQDLLDKMVGSVDSLNTVLKKALERL